ncbi:hypothetical protein BDR26DRAFT_799848 [Obelidium mucronatum]|nr:hypothetical protein BDR26DRAFT_799848 [Obelidium mucronatum]
MNVEIAVALVAILVSVCAITYFSNPSVRVNWSNEIVLVTGGTQGLGLAFIKTLLSRQKPKHIVVLSLHKPSESFDSFTFFECDVSEFKNVEEAGRIIVAQVGIPTMIVNNAGILGGKKFIDMDPDVIQNVIKVNLLGPMWTTRVFLPLMIERNHGHILNVCSILALSGSMGVAEYCASKFGLSGFTEAMIQETKHTNVKVSAIYPGLISTALFTGVRYRFNLFPTLSPERVASEMIAILGRGKSVEVVIPLIANLGRAMKLVPVGLQNFAKDVCIFSLERMQFKPDVFT